MAFFKFKFLLLLVCLFNHGVSGQRSKVSIEKEIPVDSAIYNFSDEQPEFPGGDVGMRRYLEGCVMSNAPNSCLSTIDGRERVILKFVVEEDGTVTNVTIERPSDSSCFDDTAKYCVENMPTWKPATSNGNPIRFSQLLPVAIIRE